MSGVSSAGGSALLFGFVGFGLAGIGVTGMMILVMVLWFPLVVVSAQFLGLCRLFKGLSFGVLFLLFKLMMVSILGLIIWGPFVMLVGFLMASFPPFLLSYCPNVISFFLIERMLHIRGLAVRISKVKGHADEALVRAGTVRGFDKLGNDGADEA